jgi:hypothetical protein
MKPGFNKSVSQQAHAEFRAGLRLRAKSWGGRPDKRADRRGAKRQLQAMRD